jgi:acyl transferase domain-containing protein
MDPQQRKLLEVVFECFENSGASLESVSGSNTGVYVGNFSQDNLLMQAGDPDDLHRYTAIGTGLTMLANRVSHTFNLHGPRYCIRYRLFPSTLWLYADS